jgi:DNA-binding transcriptional MerR regulator
MTISLDGKTYYRTAEACRLAGISRNTYFRWLREGLLPDVGIRDRRGWRLFTEEDLLRLRSEANRVTKT